MDVYQRRRLVALSSVIGVFVIVVLAVASGGDDPAPVTEVGATGATGQQGAQSLSKAQYIREADAICTEASSSIENIDPSDALQAANQQARVLAEQLQRLRELPPPARDEALAESFLAGLGDELDLLRDRRIAIERGDDVALGEIEAALAAQQAASRAAAEEFGFEVCGDPEAESGEEPITGAPVEPAPVEPAPVEPAPVEPAPVEPPPVDEGDTGGVTPEDGGSSGGISP